MWSDHISLDPKLMKSSILSEHAFDGSMPYQRLQDGERLERPYNEELNETQPEATLVFWGIHTPKGSSCAAIIWNILGEF